MLYTGTSNNKSKRIRNSHQARLAEICSWESSDFANDPF